MRASFRFVLMLMSLVGSYAKKVCESKCIIVAQKGELAALQLEGLQKTQITSTAGAVISLDADSRLNNLYFSNYSAAQLETCYVNNYQGRKKVTKGHGTDIVVESKNGYLYWTDLMGKSIGRTNIDGSDARILIKDSVNVKCPLGIGVDADVGSLFWTDPCLSVIQRADLDGSNYESVISDSSLRPVSLALDKVNQKIYWGDKGGSIQRMDYNGEGLIKIFEKSKLYPISIAYDDGVVYFSDRQHREVGMVDVKTSIYQRLLSETVYALTVFQPPQYTDGGWGEWGCWTPCSVSCGSGGKQVRKRICDHPSPALGGDPCPGSDTMTQDCTVEASCEHPEAKDFAKVGCFDDGDRSFDLLFTDRETKRPLDEEDCFNIDWIHYQAYAADMVRRCASASREKGMSYFAVQYYGECWASNDYSKYKSSNKCTDEVFSKSCDEASDALCVGKSLTNFVYVLN